MARKQSALRDVGPESERRMETRTETDSRKGAGCGTAQKQIWLFYVLLFAFVFCAIACCDNAPYAAYDHAVAERGPRHLYQIAMLGLCACRALALLKSNRIH